VGVNVSKSSESLSPISARCEGYRMRRLGRGGRRWAAGALAALMLTASHAGTADALGGTSSNLIRNGGFEYPDVAFADLFSTGQTMGAWRVVGGSVDLLDSTYWPGGLTQHIDLAGVEDGMIAQRVATLPGHSYLLRFRLAASPDLGCPPEKTIVVRFGGSEVARLVVPSHGRTVENLGWTLTQFRVYATSTASTLTFESRTQDTVCGALIDSVSLRPVE
jgi:hypothetical protein